jgi:hypothetical protein
MGGRAGSGERGGRCGLEGDTKADLRAMAYLTVLLMQCGSCRAIKSACDGLPTRDHDSELVILLSIRAI